MPSTSTSSNIPDRFFDGAFERAVLDPTNPVVAGRHAACAAAELPIRAGEGFAPALLDGMVQDGGLVQDERGDTYFSFRRNPQRDVQPRAAAQPFQIVEAPDGRHRGSVDGMRVYHECHPGAVYLHGGRSYRVTRLEAERRRVWVEPVRADYYTTVLGDKQTEILERLESRMLGCFPVGFGRLRVTVQIREYQKRGCSTASRPAPIRWTCRR